MGRDGPEVQASLWKASPNGWGQPHGHQLGSGPVLLCGRMGVGMKSAGHV